MWNEILGWFSILAGVLMGSYMGIKFQREDWLGGYFFLPRRMVRLAHIALVALGMLNILFAQSLESLKLRSGYKHSGCRTGLAVGDFVLGRPGGLVLSRSA